MKKRNLLLSIALPIILSGCLLGSEPTAVEREFFDIETTQVPIVTLMTNIEDGTAVIISKTNWVEAFNFSPGEKARAVVETGTAIGNFFGVGGLVGTILGGLFGLWGKFRSSKLNKTASILAQVIETGRKVMGTTPQGQQLESKWVAWMSKYQTETGVVLEVSKLLKKVVDKKSAQLVADQLIALTKTAQATQPPKK